MNRRVSNSTSADFDDPFVINTTEDGFIVYRASEPGRWSAVGETPDGLECNCAEFLSFEGERGRQCEHIHAVVQHLNDGVGTNGNGNGRPQQRQENPPDSPDNPAQMLLKRSVSPDGRIDSLSVEFSCPVDSLPVAQIKSRALATLQLQADIVQTFLKGGSVPAPRQLPETGNGHRDGNGDGRGNGNGGDYSNRAASARLLQVCGMDGKWGRRLYINVRSNGQTLKLFGSEKQLAKHVSDAGYPDSARDLVEGIYLDIPCRIETKRSDDGRWLNIERLLPAQGGASNGRSRR